MLLSWNWKNYSMTDSIWCSLAHKFYFVIQATIGARRGNGVTRSIICCLNCKQMWLFHTVLDLNIVNYHGNSCVAQSPVYVSVSRFQYLMFHRTKLNVHISNVKLNLSESKLRLLAYYLNKLLVLYENNIEKYKATLKSSISERKSSIIFISTKELMKVQSSICLPSVTMMHSDFKPVIKEVVTNNVPKLDR